MHAKLFKILAVAATASALDHATQVLARSSLSLFVTVLASCAQWDAFEPDPGLTDGPLGRLRRPHAPRGGV